MISLDIIMILLITVGAEFEAVRNVLEVTAFITLAALLLGVVDETRDVSVASVGLAAAAGTISDA